MIIFDISVSYSKIFLNRKDITKKLINKIVLIGKLMAFKLSKIMPPATQNQILLAKPILRYNEIKKIKIKLGLKYMLILGSKIKVSKIAKTKKRMFLTII